jgi:uncharacterized membrane protein
VHPSRPAALILTAALASIASPAARAQTGASFQGLGDLFNNQSGSSGLGVSADGSTVVGIASSSIGDQAFRWTRSGGMVGLGIPVFFDPDQYCCLGTGATAASADGSVLTGYEVENENGNLKAWRWTQADGMVEITDPDAFGAGRAISADGATIAGELYTGFLAAVGYRWTQPTGIVSIDPVGSTQSLVWGMSSDGSTVAGSYGGFPSEAFRWTEGAGFQLLGNFPGGPFGGNGSGANALSGDGTTVAGFGFVSASQYHALRWSSETGLQDLGTISPTDRSSAFGASADGSAIVGFSHSGTANSERAFIWTPQAGMQDIQALLVSRGVNMAGWRLRIAYAVSADGRTVVGNAFSPTSSTQAFVAYLGAPCRPDVNGDGTVNVADFLAFLQLYSAADNRADFDNNGSVNVADFLAFLALFAAGC